MFASAAYTGIVIPSRRRQPQPKESDSTLERGLMPRTRALKSGDSRAVRISSELAYANTAIDLEITRVGDVITIFPARGSLKRRSLFLCVGGIKRVADNSADFSDVPGLSTENWVV